MFKLALIRLIYFPLITLGFTEVIPSHIDIQSCHARWVPVVGIAQAFPDFTHSMLKVHSKAFSPMML